MFKKLALLAVLLATGGVALLWLTSSSANEITPDGIAPWQFEVLVSSKGTVLDTDSVLLGTVQATDGKLDVYGVILTDHKNRRKAGAAKIVFRPRNDMNNNQHAAFIDESEIDTTTTSIDSMVSRRESISNPQGFYGMGYQSSSGVLFGISADNDHRNAAFGKTVLSEYVSISGRQVSVDLNDLNKLLKYSKDFLSHIHIPWN